MMISTPTVRGKMRQIVGARIDGHPLCAEHCTPAPGSSPEVLASTLDHLAELARWGRLTWLRRDVTGGVICEMCHEPIA